MTKRILTDEVRNELLGAIPFSSEVAIAYTPARFKDKKVPEEYVPVFKLRSFNIQERKKAGEVLKSIADIGHQAVMDLVQPNILGMENIFDAGTKEEIEFKTAPNSNAIDKDLLARLPKLIIEDILYYLVKISGLMDLEKLGLRF